MDTTDPASPPQAMFLAILEQPSPDRTTMPTYAVHFVNATDARVVALTRDTGGHTSDDDGLLLAQGTTESLGAVEAQSSLQIGSEDAGSFDFAVWWTLEAKLEDGTLRKMTFAVPKWFPMRSGDAEYGPVPVLGALGWVVMSKPR